MKCDGFIEAIINNGVSVHVNEKYVVKLIIESLKRNSLSSDRLLINLKFITHQANFLERTHEKHFYVQKILT